MKLEDYAKGGEKVEVDLKSFKDLIRGRVTILFGAPMVGKTLFAHLLSREFDNPILLKVDNNYKDEYKEINKKLKYIEITSPQQLLFQIKNLMVNVETLIIIDSLTTSASDIIGERMYTSPRAFNELAQFYDAVFNRLAKFRGLATSLVICHEKLLDFKTGEIGPRLNLVTLRNVDLVLRMVEEEGKRKIKVWRKREKVDPRSIEKVELEA